MKASPLDGSLVSPLALAVAAGVIALAVALPYAVRGLAPARAAPVTITSFIEGSHPDAETIRLTDARKLPEVNYRRYEGKGDRPLYVPLVPLDWTREQPVAVLMREDESASASPEPTSYEGRVTEVRDFPGQAEFLRQGITVSNPCFVLHQNAAKGDLAIAVRILAGGAVIVLLLVVHWLRSRASAH